MHIVALQFSIKILLKHLYPQITAFFFISSETNYKIATKFYIKDGILCVECNDVYYINDIHLQQSKLDMNDKYFNQYTMSNRIVCF